MTTFPTTSIPSKFLSSPHDLGLIAVGFSGGQCKPGTEAAPSALIDAGLLDQLKTDLGYTLHHDNTVHTYDDLLPRSVTHSPSDSQPPTTPDPDPSHRNMKNPLSVSLVTEKLSNQVYAHAREGRMVLTLGGDHSIAIGTISGTARAIKERLGKEKEMGVIWVDAHADINTPETSASGNVHGMPLAWLTGLARPHKGREDIFGWIARGEEAPVKLAKLVYIGLRDVDPGEKRILREHQVKAFSMHDIDRWGIGRVMDLALEYLGEETPVHLSFDVDALDPQWAPSTGTPVRGGLTLREGDFICECVHGTGRCVGIDLVEVNPLLEANGREETVRAGVSLVRCALGDTLL